MLVQVLALLLLFNFITEDAVAQVEECKDEYQKGMCERIKEKNLCNDPKMMKNDAVPVEATLPIRILASALVLFPAVIGLSLQALLAVALYRGWHIFQKSSFYLITVQRDTCALLIDLYAAFPMILTDIQYMGDGLFLYYIPLAFEGVAFNGIFMLSFYLTVNRFFLFIFPTIHARFFSSRETKMVSLCIWIYVFTLVGLSNVFGCKKEFSKRDFFFWYNCEISRSAAVYRKFFEVQSYIVTPLMAIMYIFIYAKLKLSHFWKPNKTMSLKGETKYLIQTLLICVLITIEIVSFTVVPILGITGYGRFYVNMLVNLIFIANNMVTPVVILAFNHEVREKLQVKFQWGKVSTIIYFH